MVNGSNRSNGSSGSKGPNGHGSNGHGSNGYGSNGHGSNGNGSNGSSKLRLAPRVSMSPSEMSSIAYLMTFVDNVPTGDDWLGPHELERQLQMRVPKRRREWRLGRWIAKRVLRSWRHNVPMERLEIRAAEDGAPEAYEGPRALPISLSITHRSNVAVCAVAEPGCKLGCDLEVLEPRSALFVNDFFTADERAAVHSAAPAARDWLACLIWSAKESALKALREGLRRDTRSVEVSVPRAEHRLLMPDANDLDGASECWHPLSVYDRITDVEFRGWWWRKDRLLLTTASTPAARMPIALDRERTLDKVLAGEIVSAPRRTVSWLPERSLQAELAAQTRSDAEDPEGDGSWQDYDRPRLRVVS
jgi:4'-phosphopantetheinyl transferase